MGSGFQTFVAGSVLTASEVNNFLMEQSVMSFASAAARALAVTSPETGMMFWDQALLTLNVYNGSAWVSITPSGANVATSETTTSASYVDLATSGPAVSVTTGTKALVTISAYMQPSTTATLRASVAVSGATTVAAADSACIRQGQSAGLGSTNARTVLLTGLTAGSNTFTIKYKTDGGTATFDNRGISVQALP
jgi:hypothetical protein